MKTTSFIITALTIVLAAAGVWVAWASGQPGGICAVVATPPIC
jgi:hypothetical protein